MCGSMADIQSAKAEIRRGRKEEQTTGWKYIWPALLHRADINYYLFNGEPESGGWLSGSLPPPILEEYFWGLVEQMSFLSSNHQGRVANPRPVATVKKLVTAASYKWQVFTRTVGHSETSFLGRSSDLDRSSGNGVRVYETGLGFATRRRCQSIEGNS